jgi:hypothetical protein
MVEDAETDGVAAVDQRRGQEDVAGGRERGDDRLVPAVRLLGCLARESPATERQDAQRRRTDELEPVVGLDPALGVGDEVSERSIVARNAPTPNVSRASQTLIASSPGSAKAIGEFTPAGRRVFLQVLRWRANARSSVARRGP